MKNKLRLLIKTVISMLLLSSGNALAAGGQCRSVFTRAARSEAFQMVRELNNRFFDLDQVDQDLRVFIKETEAITEEYFSKAQITYEKVKRVNTIEAGGQKYQDLESHEYHILAGSMVDSNARFIQGFYKKAQDPKARIVYDPFLTLLQDGTHGFYISDNHHIVVTALALAEREVNLGSTLNHEVRHYFEHMKILRGLRTLARFDLSNGRKIEGDLYSDYASLDELETHIRDFRLLKDLAPSHIEFLIENGTPAESFEMFKEYRQDQIASKLKVIQDVSGKALDALEEIRSMTPIKYSMNKDHQMEVSFKLRKNHYKELRVELSGIDFTREDYKKLARQQLAIEIDFAEKRINQLLDKVLNHYIRTNTN